MRGVLGNHVGLINGTHVHMKYTHVQYSSADYSRLDKFFE